MRAITCMHVPHASRLDEPCRSSRSHASPSHRMARLLQMPPTPPVDPDNEEFVIFVRSKKVRGAAAYICWQL